MSAVDGLAALLAPMPLETFLGSVWGRKHHHGTASVHGRFADLLTDRRFEEVLSAIRPHSDMLGLYKEGKALPFSQLLLADGSVDMVQLRGRYAEGYSIVLNGLERFAPEFRLLTNAIAADIDFESQVNVYVTPPHARGFSPHFDDHDVLVLQVRGSKTWHVHLTEPLVPPERFRERERAVDTTALSEPDRITLSPGDILYLPRGRVHAAETAGGASVHLTIGLHPPSLLAVLAASFEARGASGKGLLDLAPPRYLSDPALRCRIAAAVRDLASQLEDEDVEHGLAAIEDRVIRSGRGAIGGHFIAADDRVLLPQSVMRRSTRLPARLIPLGESVGLQFSQALVVAEADHRSAFEYLLSQQEPFRIADLPGLAPEAQAALGEKLMHDGFLEEMPAESYDRRALIAPAA